MDHDALLEIEKYITRNKKIKMLILAAYVETLLKQFFHLLLLRMKRDDSLSAVDLNFNPQTWDCLADGRLVYVSHIV